MTTPSRDYIEKRVLRFNVAIDDSTQELPAGKILLVTPDRQGRANSLEVWVECTTDEKWPHTGTVGVQKVRVFGTGRPIDVVNTAHLYSVRTDPFIWHLYRIYEGG